MYRSMKVTPKLIVFFLLVGVGPLSVIALFSYQQASEALTSSSYAQLLAVRQIKRNQVQNYLAERFADTNVLRNRPTVLKSIVRLEEAFDSGGVNGPEYRAAEQEYGPLFVHYQKTYGYHDLLLIANDGDIVFTVKKESDLGENLVRGALSTTNLAEAFRRRGEGAILTDYEMYEPSGIAASFVLGQIRDQSGKPVGAIAMQINTEKIDEMMQERAGMGETGESYLVGPDKLMRSNSRFLRELGMESTLLKLRVDTQAVNSALGGSEGQEIIQDYRKKRVLSSWAPLDIPGIKWVIVTEIDEAEAFAAVSQLSEWTLLAGLALAGLVMLLGVWVARSFSKPITEVVEMGKRVAVGDIDQEKIVVRTGDEIGELGHVFNDMIDYLTQIAGAANLISDGNLNVAVESRSQRDQLSNSFISMVEYLNETAEVADKVAAGDLTVTVEPRGKEDRLGNSLTQMVAGLRELVSKVQEAAEQVAASSEELSSGAQSTAQGAQHIAQGAEKQTATVEQTSAIIQQLSSSTQQVTSRTQSQDSSMQQIRTLVEAMNKAMQEIAVNARQVAGSAEQAAGEAREGGDSIKQSIQAMAQISDRSEKVGEIIGVITDISDQINLLALNAAIEAARAGEQGRGFAVVAEGITKLADRSQEATREVAEVIKDTMRVVKKGTEVSDKASEAIQKINVSVESVSGLIQEISDSTGKQAEDSGTVSKSIEDVSELTTQIGQMALQQAQNAEELVKSSKTLGDISLQNASIADQASTQAAEATSSSEELVAQSQALQQATTVFRISSGVTGRRS